MAVTVWLVLFGIVFFDMFKHFFLQIVGGG